MALRSRRRQPWLGLAVAFGVALVIGAAVAVTSYALVRPAGRVATVAPDPSPSTTPGAVPAPSGSPTVLALRQAPATHSWQRAETSGAVLGSQGPVQPFHIAVENGLPVTVEEFTAMVDSTLGDGRSWVGAGTVRLRRVPSTATASFTIYLAQPATAYQLCLSGGVDITVGGVPFTSCRVGNKVVINADRYTLGAPGYGAPLDDYRRYVINHEVGHWLGHDHVDCPGAGQPAPVMQQQTLGLQGCVANSWPLVGGALLG